MTDKGFSRRDFLTAGSGVAVTGTGAGVETEALTDFSDMLPTFVELGGGTIPEDLTIDGVSIAPLILGKKGDSSREWIMALGHGAAKLDEKGLNVSRTGGKLLQLRWALDARVAAGRPLLTDLEQAFAALTLDDARQMREARRSAWL